MESSGKIDKVKLAVHPRFRNSKLLKALVAFLLNEKEAIDDKAERTVN
jgi:hypothetical protein